MFRNRTSTAGPVAGFLLVLATLALVAACGAAAPSSAPATPVPSAPAQTEQPSEAPPSDAAGDGGIELDTVDDSRVVVVVDDQSGKVAAVRSGTAKDGMSVKWFDVVIENVDADTLRVTWVGLPVDVEIALGVHANGDGYELAFVQPGPPENSDAIGFDRVLEIDFAAPVDAGDVTATFTQG